MIGPMRAKLIETGADLTRLRERLGMTQEEMAAALGVSGRRAVSHWEHGRRGIHPMVARLCWYLEHHGPIP
jgi:transcriptional regulator with XRE-family HTH domain